MNTSIQKISYLPDLSMPKHGAQYGNLAKTFAGSVPYNILLLLRPGKDEWLGLRYAYTPNRTRPQERLAIYIKEHSPNGKDGGHQFRGAHILSEFYVSSSSTEADAYAALQGRDVDILSLQKCEEALFDKKRDFLYYVPRPFQLDGSAFGGIVPCRRQPQSSPIP